MLGTTTGHALLKAAALLAAAIHDTDNNNPLPTADTYYHWLTGPHRAVTAILTASEPVSRNQPEGNTMSLVMPDNDQVTITVAALDTEQVPVADPFTDPAGIYLAPFTWTVDNTALGELTVSTDTLSVILMSATGQTGTVNVTATDTNGKVVPPFAVEIDPSAAVSAGLVAGTPVPRTTA
jgi:hypothetical protein